MPKGSEDYSKGKALPSPVTPASTVCFKITIPDAVQYRAALFGVLSQLSNWYTWDHPTDGTTCEDCEEAAQLWAKAISEAYFEEDCEDIVSCDDIADCIETSEAVQTAIQTISGNTINDKVVVPATYPPGQPNPTPSVDLAAGTNPTCSKDILWAQCLAIAQQTNLAIVDVLQKIEVTTNSAELLDALTEVPLVGWAKEALGGQAALDLINYYQEAVEEQYQAQYTETAGGVQDQIACAIFCACKSDCVITIDRLFDVLKARVEAYVTIPTLDTFEDLIDFAAGLSQDNTMVVDVAFFFAWGSIKLGSFFFGRAFDITLSMLLQLSINDASSDWQALCIDCPDLPSEICAGSDGSVDFRDGNGAFTPYANRAIYHTGQGWGNNPAVLSTRVSIIRAMAPTITRIKFNTIGDAQAIRLNTYNSGFGALLGSTTTFVTETDGSRTYTIASVAAGGSPQYAIDIGGSSALVAGFRLRWICWNYDV